MSLSKEQFRRVEEEFHDLFERSESEREARLAEVAASDPEVARELERMLADDVRSAAATERLDPARAAFADANPDTETAHPTQIGRYTIVRLAGEGGMGRVYEATQQEPVKRRVAVKLMRDVFASASARARFHAEQQALAVMDHPNIARVYDADVTEAGFPYFVMEWVDGVPLTAYCDREALDLEQRLELFSQVLDAVRHAHQKGIIHRDLKPSNILVRSTGSDASSESGTAGSRVRARVKVIDFGIAKAMGEPMMSGTHGTRVGDLIGTPEYMSPEQALLGRTDVDVRSDVYSLGLLLFELLTGDLPVSRAELRRAGFDEMRRQVMEVEAPRPSDRIRATTPDGQPRTVGDATSLARRVRGDLDWIVLKALAKERERRYDSVTALSDDLRRHREDQPVSAGPPTLSYKLRKFVRRNRIAVVAGCLLALAVIAGLVGTSYGLVEARRATARTQEALTEAQQERATAQSVANYLRDLFQSADPREQAGREITVDEILGRGVDSIDDLEDEPRIQLSLLGLFGDIYRAQDQMDRSEELLRRVIAFENEAVDREVLLNDQSLARARLGGLLRDRGDFEGAREVLTEGLSEAETVLGPTSDVLGALHNNLGTVFRRLDQYEKAQESYRKALFAAEANEDPPGPNVATVVNNLASVDHFLGDYESAARNTERAIALFETVIPEGHPYFGTLYQNLSAIQRNLPDLPGALDASRRSVEIMRTALGPDHSSLAGALVNQGWVERNLGQLDAALQSTAEAVAILERTIGLDNRTAAPILARHASVLHQLGRGQEAVPALEQALAVYDFDQPDNQRLTDLDGMLGYARDLSTVLRHLGRVDDAAAVTQRGLEAYRRFEAELTEGEPRLVALTRPAVAALHLERALQALAVDDTETSDRHYAEALELANCVADRPCDLDSTEATIQRAGFLAQRGRTTDALGALEHWLERGERVWWASRSVDLAPLRDLPSFTDFELRWHRLIAQTTDP